MASKDESILIFPNPYEYANTKTGTAISNEIIEYFATNTKAGAVYMFVVSHQGKDVTRKMVKNQYGLSDKALDKAVKAINKYFEYTRTCNEQKRDNSRVDGKN